MDFTVHYRVRYEYDAAVAGSLNELRVIPATTGTQRCDAVDVEVRPAAERHRHTDIFGTDVIQFLVPGRHEELEIDLVARVVTAAPLPPPQASWAKVRTDGYRDAGGPYRQHTATQAPDGIDELVRQIEREHPDETCAALIEVIPDRLVYEEGSTDVTTPVEEVLRQGRGVCQDFAHVSLVLLRELGLAARYVSGYYWAAPPDGTDASLEVQTHAWVEVLLPAPGDDAPASWVGYDPTNRCLASDRHVKVGHGRLYGDVAPIKGSFFGSAASTTSAKVTMRRQDA